MAVTLVREWAQRNWWRFGVLTIAAWSVFYIAVSRPAPYQFSVAEQKATGLAAVGWDPISLWREPAWHRILHVNRKVAMSRAAILGPALDSSEDVSAVDTGRKMVREDSLEFEFKNPEECVEKIRLLAERMGGYLVSSEMSGSDAAIVVRVPILRFEEARAEIRSMALRVESEKLDAKDVTRDYADREAQLHNLRATEAQYLSIVKRSATVHDTLEVSAKLSEIRGQIEQQQAEFKALAQQVETVAIAVTLRAEADTTVLGMHWRPWYDIKVGARDGLDSLAGYARTMTTFVFYLPTIALWIATIVFLLAATWRISGWIWSRFFVQRANQPEPAK